MKNKKVKLIAAGLALAVILLLIFKKCSKAEQNIGFETSTVTRGLVSNTVTATGTIQAIQTVDVGTQVSGVIKKIYADFNSNVKKGQLLAQLDMTPLQASVEEARATLADAQAEADYQTSNYNRIKALYEKQLVAQTDFDLATYNNSKSKANLKALQIRFDKAKINLDYASIYSPIDGVVLHRAVDEGQTVAASFNTPTLFSIANDLTQMQVEASIDEADIGQVKDGQRVEFSVDAFPEMKFAGEVVEIRLQPVEVSNVVTYTVIVKAPNPDKKLMPGMTANIIIVTEESTNVLVVPGKALRFIPDSALMQVYTKRMEAKVGHAPDSLRMPNGKTYRMKPNEKSTNARIWIKEGDWIRPVPVTEGLNDGINVEIKEGLKEGDEVVLSMSTESSENKDKGNTTRSPFMPGPPRRK